MEVQAHDRSTMTLVDIVLVQTSFRPSTVVSVGLVDIAFFGTDQECRRFVVWEIERGDGYLPGLVVASVDEL